MRLTEAEKDLICTMCNIASVQGEDADGRGEGDYQDWTPEDFAMAERIFEKLFDPVAFAKKLAGTEP